uniref:Protein kinase domain-containing protein n=1 Tax=Oryza glumipatula TaxID=40148 RepID=A0A0E0B1U9_9ORYZ
MVAADLESKVERPYRTLRSFPSGDRNCYSLPTVAGAKYLIRMSFYYGNYDGKDSSSTLQFDLYIGVDRWTTVHGDSNGFHEALFVAWASWAPVCLVRTSPGATPFVSSVELRPLGSGLYPDLMANESMYMADRKNMGSNNSVIEYKDDLYDRYWWPMPSNPTWKNISTASPIDLASNYAVPSPVIQTAIEAVSTNTTLTLYTWKDQGSNGYEYKVYMHFADFQNSQLRQFNISFNTLKEDQYSPPYLAPFVVFNTRWYKSNDGEYNITLQATAASKLPPMINAIELYTRISHINPRTLPRDLDAIMAIKFEYGIKKNWMGDPCFPVELGWDGVRCSNASGNTTKIIALDLSNSNLHGPISNNFTLFTELEYFLDYNINPCNPPPPPTKKGNKAVIIAISVVVPVIAIGALVLVYLIWRWKTKSNVPSANPPREPELEIAPATRKYDGDALQKVENRRFTYKELEKLTNKFEKFIGQGGFGLVYYGRLEDGTEVAVKMRSESSSHGLDEFFAEVQSLTKVHHRNLVSLVGYCREKDNLALVYEYMARGSLYDHLRERAFELWLKPHKAKIADFGLCKTYLSDTQTHISVTPAGSAGYMDPEYYHTGRLMESSDVYSFGVVLLEIVTGESPILPGQGHIIQLVKKKIAAGNISLVADARLGGAYDVSSMWKVVDTALSCTADIGAERPTMATVVVQLKESLALEEARGDSGFRGSISTVSDTMYPNDPYDRYWWQMWHSDPTWKNISSLSTVKEDSNFAVPYPVMQTAIEAIDNSTILNITWVNKMLSVHNIKLLLHFADFQNSQLRQFNASLNNAQPYQYSPPYLTAEALFNSGWSMASDGEYTIRLEPTSVSKLPPMINALEIYSLISHNSPTTLQADFETIMGIKLEYGIKKNWMGDPCFPVKFAWEVSEEDIPRDQAEVENIPDRIKAHGDILHKVENRQFSFNELEKFTNRFERFIGQGGFGPVYFGRLEDNTEVAVKIRSESSSHGITEFFAEVQSLTKVHHRNLVSLVGYCCENDHLALVYEYMARGSLSDHLRDNNGVSETLNWRTRVQVVIEAAQGLDYLHKGCNLPIIHRDVKIADFGLSKTYLSETQTHISVTAAATTGYIDPEYYYTGRLTESSDVYSFGIVLLEIATGESPILPGQGHIVQRVKRKIDAGDIRLVADPRLKGAYEVSSMLKVVDTALLCTADVSAQRPAMADVVVQLKESLAMAEAHDNISLRGSIGTTSA